MKINTLSIHFFLCLVASFSVNAQVINAGVGGNTTTDLLGRLDADVLEQQPDLVLLMVGTNDMLNSKKMVSYRDYEANLVQIVHKIQATGSKIVLLSPPTVDSIYLFQRHDKTLFKDPPNVKLDSVRAVMQRVSANDGLKYLDINQSFRKRNLPEHNKDIFIQNESNSGRRDGVHPTRLGYRFISGLVFNFIKREYEGLANMKIVCFGDSITYGAGAKNKGTGKGEDYPEVLANLIEENSATE